MLEFKIFDDERDKRVFINPELVSSVIETEDRHCYGGFQPIAIIHMSTGEKYRVYDSVRKASKLIQEHRNRQLTKKEIEKFLKTTKITEAMDC